MPSWAKQLREEFTAQIQEVRGIAETANTKGKDAIRRLAKARDKFLEQTKFEDVKDVKPAGQENSGSALDVNTLLRLGELKTKIPQESWDQIQEISSDPASMLKMAEVLAGASTAPEKSVKTLNGEAASAPPRTSPGNVPASVEAADRMASSQPETFKRLWEDPSTADKMFELYNSG